MLKCGFMELTLIAAVILVITLEVTAPPPASDTQKLWAAPVPIGRDAVVKFPPPDEVACTCPGSVMETVRTVPSPLIVPVDVVDPIVPAGVTTGNSGVVKV